MKRIILAGILAFGVLGAQAGCLDHYSKASDTRIQRNDFLRMGMLGAAGASFLLSAGATAPLFAVVFLGNGAFGNQRATEFSKISKAIVDSETSNFESRELQSIVRELNRVRAKDHKADLEVEEVAAVLIEANESDALCPVVTAEENGEAHQTVYNRKALMVLLNSKL